MPSDLEHLRDENLATLARAPSLPHFEEIVRRYQVPLRHFLRQRFPSRRDVDDILQDSFLKVWQSLHLYDPKFSFRTWLYTIAYRTAVSYGRRDRPAQTLPAALSAGAPAPDTFALRREEHQSVWTLARGLLSDEQFTALWLHYVDDMPARDIGRVLNCSWVNVKTLMHRARKKLAPHLADTDSQPAGASEGRSAGALPENKGAVLCLAKNR